MSSRLVWRAFLDSVFCFVYTYTWSCHSDTDLELLLCYLHGTSLLHAKEVGRLKSVFWRKHESSDHFVVGVAVGHGDGVSGHRPSALIAPDSQTQPEPRWVHCRVSWRQSVFLSDMKWKYRWSKPDAALNVSVFSLGTNNRYIWVWLEITGIALNYIEITLESVFRFLFCLLKNG